MQAHPLPDRLERPPVDLGDGAAPIGTDVEDEVSVLRHRVDEHANEEVGGLVVDVVAIVSPGAVERLARLPANPSPVLLHRRGGLVLLGGDEVAGDVESIIDEDPGLKLGHHLEELLRAPVLLPLADPAVRFPGVGEVEEEVVDGPVVAEEFADLGLEVGAVLGHRAFGMRLPGIGVVASGVVEVVGEVRMVPVEERVVEADFQPLLAQGVDPFAHEVASLVTHARVVGARGVPEAEAVVVLRREDGVGHPRPLRETGDPSGVEEVRLEELGVALVVFDGAALPGHHPLVAGCDGVETEMHEETETIMGEPGLGSLLIRGDGTGHRFFFHSIGLSEPLCSTDRAHTSGRCGP